MSIHSNSQIKLYDIQSILISRLRFMGDVILTTPLIRALRQKFQEAHIAYLTETPYAELLQHNPHLDTVLAFDRENLEGRGIVNRLAIYGKLLSSLRANRFDLTIDLLGNPRSAWMTWLTGARYRVGGDFRGRRYLYTIRVRDDGQPKTAIDFHLKYLAAIGVSAQGTKTELITTRTEDEGASDYLNQLEVDKEKLIIGIHVGASWPAKRWLPERFSVLAERLISEYNAEVIFTEGPGEDGLVQQVRSRITRKTHSAGILSLRRLAALLKHLDVFISNDCGPMHLAPAVNTNTIGIFGPGEPKIWFPYNSADGHRVVYKEIDCSRCHKDICEKMDCMKSIQVDDVMSEVEKSLGSVKK
jgi:predicted lipopolysaccharide heptosyltransferase III